MFLVYNTGKAQTKPKSCGFDNYRESILRENPNLKNILKQAEAKFKTSESAKISSDQIIVIPVVVHILHKGGEAIGSGSNITDEKVNEQIQILNDFYSNSNNKGVDTKIRFCLAKNNISGTVTSGILRNVASKPAYNNPAGNTDEDRSIKLVNGSGLFPSYTFLNIWVTTLEDKTNPDIQLLGYSSFPSPGDSNFGLLDGVVIDYRSFGTTTRSGSDKGMTAVHEIGHWLGLFHTFQTTLIDDLGTEDWNDDIYTDQCQENPNYCNTINDVVCDTEPVKGPAQSLPAYEVNPAIGKDCNNNNSNAVQNVMDYNDDEYYNFFTPGQVERMRDQLQMYRPSFTRVNVSFTECTVPLNYNPDPTSGCDDFPEIIEDDWGYRIKGVRNGITSVNNKTLAILGPDGLYVLFYEINECGIEEKERLYFSNQIGYVGNIYLKDNFLFVQRSNDPYVSSVLVYQRNSINAWEYKQEMLGLLNFGQQIIFKNNILLLREPSKIVSYKYDGTLFVERNVLNHFEIDSSNSSDIIEEFVFNGKYLALRKYNNRAELHMLNSSNNFERVFPNNSSEEDTFATQSLAITNEIDNRLIFAGGPGIVEYNLNDLSPSGKPNSISSHDINYNGVFPRFALQDDLLIILSRHVTFFNRLSNNFEQILLPIDFPLDHQYSTRTSSGLFPVPRRYDRFQPPRSGDYTPQIDGNIMLIRGNCSNDIYLYNLESLLNRDITDRQVCQKTLGSNYIRGKNITVGGATCQVSIGGNTEIAATESIILKPGTTIKTGNNFVAKIKGKANCKLTGGHALSIPITNSTYIPLRFNFDDYSNENFLEEDIKIYPNPTKGILTMTSLQDNQIISGSVTNLTGAKVLDFNNVYKNNSFELNISNFPTGIFIVNFNMKDGSIISKKIIKE